MAQVAIDTNEMRGLAVEIEVCVTQMVDLLNGILNAANALVTTFNMVGQAITNFLSNISIEINIVINRCCADMRRFSGFLREAADAFDAAENQGVTRADNLGNVF
jgi:hypothetical protein